MRHGRHLPPVYTILVSILVALPTGTSGGETVVDPLEQSHPMQVGYELTGEAGAECNDCANGSQGCCCECCNGGCPKKKAKPNPCATSHKGVFYNNEFSYLNDPKYTGCCLGDRLKKLPVGACSRWGTLDVGGQFRLRYHHEIGMGQDRALGNARFQNTTHDFLLSRLRLYADWRFNDLFRVYVEGIHADVADDALYVPRAIDRNHGDLQNAFVDAKLLDSLTLRIGRQELLYGAQRFVSPLDWANTRRTFEGVRLLHKSGDWATDVFYTNFVPVNAFNFDEADYDISFYGGWSTYSGCAGKTLDFFYLGLDNETSNLSLHTVGARVKGEYDGWLYELTGAGQFGDAVGFGVDQSAAMTTVGLGHGLDMPWDPTVWLYYDFATGNPSPAVFGDNNQFNHLFPLAHKYLGFIDAVQRSNIETPNMLITARPAEKLDLLMWYYLFQSNGESAVPSVGGAFPQNGSKYLGQELDIILKYAIAPRSNILCGYSHFWRGNKIDGPRDADFFYTQWLVNF